MWCNNHFLVLVLSDSIADLPVPMSGVCIVQVDSSTLFAIGGFDTSISGSDKTYFYNAVENKWENGTFYNIIFSMHVILNEWQKLNYSYNEQILLFP